MSKGIAYSTEGRTGRRPLEAALQSISGRMKHRCFWPDHYTAGQGWWLSCPRRLCVLSGRRCPPAVLIHEAALSYPLIFQWVIRLRCRSMIPLICPLFEVSVRRAQYRSSMYSSPQWLHVLLFQTKEMSLLFSAAVLYIWCFSRGYLWSPCYSPDPRRFSPNLSLYLPHFYL